MKKISYIVVATAVFLAASFTVTVIKKPFTWQKEVSLNMEFAGLKPIMGASSTWAGVRGTATFIRGVARGVDTLIASLNSSGIMNLTTYPSTTSGTNKFRLTTNALNITNDATATNPAYSRNFQICVGSLLAMEVYLNSAANPTGAGVVIVWQPKLFDSTLSSSANIQCSFGTIAGLGTSANGKTGMVCKWNTATPFDGATTGPIQGRIMAFDDTTNGQINVIGLAALNGTLACTGANDQYTLGYIANKASPYNTTAKWGWNDTPYASGNFIRWCAVLDSNTTNAGIFSTSASTTGYWVNDGVSNANIPSGYPTGAAVDTLITNEAPSAGALPGAAINFPSTGTAAPACPF